jgi:hypothetical protein
MQGRRYIVHFSDGGAGPRYFDRPLEVGAEIRDGGRRYKVELVQHASSPDALGQARLRLIEPPT